jgi:hypothetical protein
MIAARGLFRSLRSELISRGPGHFPRSTTTMMTQRIGLGIGLIVTVLLPLALLLFEVLRPVETISAILLLSGLWTFMFGLLIQRRTERLYYSGFGVVIILFSTFIVIPFRFTLGLVVVAIVALAVISAVSRPRVPALSSAKASGQGS